MVPLLALLTMTALADDCVGLERSGPQATPAGAFAFEARSATLTGSEAALDSVVCSLKGDSGLTLVVAVHTDSQGSGAYNQRMSQQRAEAVVAAVVQAGIAADRLEARGYGEDWPLGPNDTAEGRAANRRVELWVEAPEDHGGPAWTKPEGVAVAPAVVPAPAGMPADPDPLCAELERRLAAGVSAEWTLDDRLGGVAVRVTRCLGEEWTTTRDGEALYGRKGEWSLAVVPGELGAKVRLDVR